MGTFPLLFLIFCRQHSFPRKQFWLYIPFLLLFILHSDPTLMAGSRGLRWPPPTSPPLPSPSSPISPHPPHPQPISASLPHNCCLSHLPRPNRPKMWDATKVFQVCSQFYIYPKPIAALVEAFSLYWLWQELSTIWWIWWILNLGQPQQQRCMICDCAVHTCDAWKVELNYNFMKKS